MESLIARLHLHPIIDHFTIALLAIGVLADVFASVFFGPLGHRSEFLRTWHDRVKATAVQLLIVGALAAVLSRFTGESEAERLWDTMSPAAQQLLWSDVGSGRFLSHAILGTYLMYAFVSQNVAVRNGRKERSKLSLDTNGFLLTEHETAVKDFYDSDEVKSVYYPEVERLLKRLTGADRVVVFDHIVRNPVFAERGEKGARAPAKLVHNDYTFKSAPRRVRDLLPKQADRLLKNRFAEINVWRAIRGPVESSPLALCDASSLGAEEIVPFDLVYRDHVGEIYGFLYNPKHRWFYFPRMTRNEAILLKC